MTAAADPPDGHIFAIVLTRDWALLGPGLEARYAGIPGTGEPGVWGAGEFAHVRVELRETETAPEGTP
jgi:hypothetical protein